MPITSHPHARRRVAAGLSAFAVSGTALLSVGLVPDAAQAAPVHTPPMRSFDLTSEVPYFQVTQTGLSKEEAAALAERAGISAGALGEDGGFSFVDSKLADVVPSRAGKAGKDEDGRAVRPRLLDLDGLRATEVLGNDRALSLAQDLLPAPEGFDVRAVVSHTRVEVSIPRQKVRETIPVDTAVSYRLSLAGTPVVGPGAKSRIAFDGAGQVVALTETLRNVEQAGFVGIISAEDAQAECARLYGRKVTQGTPRLVYSAPALGDGSVRELLPSYACQPGNVVRDGVSSVTGLLVPASPDHAPQVAVGAERADGQVSGVVKIEGGAEPYSIAWSSRNVPLTATGQEVGYSLKGRGRSAAEVLTVQVTDANGISSMASVPLTAVTSSGEANGFGGGGGALEEVGIEQMVDEWQCAQDSANGFKSVMQAHGQTVNFDWRGASAWEQDFHSATSGGHDDQYVDAVDAQWYTGHGAPGRFTFKSNVPDGEIVPADARWGDVDLEWLQLESCQVLKDVSGLDSGGWLQSFNGLHLLNGFVTNAYCINGGTGRRFAEYLFPTWWRGSLSVSAAWAQMARDLEPSGVTYRSLSPIGVGGVFNLNDRYWGQGATGPDVPASQRIGWIRVTGTV